MKAGASRPGKRETRMPTRGHPTIVECGKDSFYDHVHDLPGCIVHGAILETLTGNAE